MPSGPNEVQAAVDTHVDLVLTTGLLLLQHVRLVLVIEELDDGLPGITVVDIVSESRGINNSQTDYTRNVLSAGDIQTDRSLLTTLTDL